MMTQFTGGSLWDPKLVMGFPIMRTQFTGGSLWDPTLVMGFPIMRTQVTGGSLWDPTLVMGFPNEDPVYWWKFVGPHTSNGVP